MPMLCLLWYIFGVCVLLALLASVVTYGPDVEHMAYLGPALFGTLAVLVATAAICLARLPRTHPVRRSRTLSAGLVAIALTLTVLLALLG